MDKYLLYSMTQLQLVMSPSCGCSYVTSYTGMNEQTYQSTDI